MSSKEIKRLKRWQFYWRKKRNRISQLNQRDKKKVRD